LLFRHLKTFPSSTTAALLLCPVLCVCSAGCTGKISVADSGQDADAAVIGHDGDGDAGAADPGADPGGADERDAGGDPGSDPSVDAGFDGGADDGDDAGGDRGQGWNGLYFPEGSVWTQDVSSAALDAQSDAVIAWLEQAGGWGNGRFQIDFSIEVLHVFDPISLSTFETTGDFWSPDCDHVPVPVPAGGAIEGEQEYECLSDGDCHLIVAYHPTHTLYEMWRCNISGGTFYGGCLAVWDMTRLYPPEGRGDQCTSADAAGYPIAPLLFSADEVAAGEIPHAIRFILPNSRIRNGEFIHPATHSTGPASGGPDAPPYGIRLRLRADFPLNTLPNDAARTVARALQRYGMFLADGGNIALTAQSDRFTTAKWSGLLEPRDLDAIQVTDFEMIEGGARIPYTGDCLRTPLGL
jgi:serine/threonine-protein kinase